MQCDCLNTFEAKLVEHYQKTAGAGEDAKAECQSRALFMTDDLGMESGLAIPFTVTGSGKGFKKGLKTTVKANYCPFCGKSTNKPSEQQES